MHGIDERLDLACIKESRLKEGLHSGLAGPTVCDHLRDFVQQLPSFIGRSDSVGRGDFNKGDS